MILFPTDVSIKRIHCQGVLLRIISCMMVWWDRMHSQKCCNDTKPGKVIHQWWCCLSDRPWEVVEMDIVKSHTVQQELQIEQS